MQPRYFVVYSDNYAFIQNQTDQPEHIPRDWNKYVIGIFIILYIFVFGAFGMAIISMRDENIQFQNTEQTTATITERNTHRRSRNSMTYYLTYIYIVDGKSYTDKRDVSSTVYYENPLGRRVEIIYPVENPNLTRMVGVHGDNSIELLGGAFIVLATLSGYGIYAIIKRYRNINLLREEGVLVTGQLMDCSTRSYKNHYYLKLTAQFTVPTTRENITGSREYVTNHLKGAPLPRLMSPLAIIYYDKDLWEIL